jgi:hypothetical protein
VAVVLKLPPNGSKMVCDTLEVGEVAVKVTTWAVCPQFNDWNAGEIVDTGRTVLVLIEITFLSKHSVTGSMAVKVTV